MNTFENFVHLNQTDAKEYNECEQCDSCQELNANVTVVDSKNMLCSAPMQSVEYESWLLNI